jgi:hypothetical protein
MVISRSLSGIASMIAFVTVVLRVPTGPAMTMFFLFSAAFCSRSASSPGDLFQRLQWRRALEDARAQRRPETRRTADRQADRLRRGDGKPTDLQTLAVRQRRRTQGMDLVDVLAGVIGGQDRDGIQPVVGQERFVVPGPYGARLDADLTRPIDDDIRRVRVIQEALERHEGARQHAITQGSVLCSA